MNWASEQLAELLALVSSFEEEDGATRVAVERAAEALEAEVAALVRGGELVTATGFPRDDVPVGELLAVADGSSCELVVPGLGPCAVLVVPVDDEEPAQFVLARAGERFDGREAYLARGMMRVLTLTLRMLRVIAAERGLRERSERQAQENANLLTELRQRQVLLERLATIQRSIVRRAKLEEVLDAVVTGAAELLDAAAATLELFDCDDPAGAVLLASHGRDRVAAAVGGSARSSTIALAGSDLGASVSAPVIENGETVGALSVIRRDRGRPLSDNERETLSAFAEHASLALTDSKNVDTALHRSLHDLLTGLPNRVLFLDRLQHASARSLRSASGPAVLFLDLDGFKRVNDRLGHAGGDELLVAVAQRLLECLRPGDTAARFGGDEFAILLEDVSSEAEAATVTERLMSALGQPFRVDDKRVAISASVGIAVRGDGDEDLLRNADLAMYEAKAAGKGRYEVFDPAMHAAVVARLRLEADLARAVERHEFELVYQPIVNLISGTVVAVEALLRWRHPERGLLAPGEFVAAAEETGMIRRIGRWVIDAACEQAASWPSDARGARPPAVCVNLSVIQLQDRGLVGEVVSALETSGLEPSRLIVEITETVLMHDEEGYMLRRLKELGVQIAVDDFGTGYSSLQYLQTLPIDILKIAKPFVQSGEHPGDAALAQAIIDVGQSLRMHVVAEGIEREEQAARLTQSGCRWGQGFYFARPQDAATLSETLRRRGVDGLAAAVRDGRAPDAVASEYELLRRSATRTSSLSLRS